MSSTNGVNWVLLDLSSKQAVRIGDRVSADAGGMPTYEVVGLDADRAWLRDGQHADVEIRPLAAFAWKAIAM